MLFRVKEMKDLFVRNLLAFCEFIIRSLTIERVILVTMII